MTTIYFVRHAQSDYSVNISRIRPLTEKGLADRRLVTEYLRDKSIDAVLSSTFKRAVDTVADFAEKYNFKVETIEDFRECESNNTLIKDDDFPSSMERLWSNVNTKLFDGTWESLAEVQERNINALNDVLIRYQDKNIAIGTHGIALSSIINYYDHSYGYEDFMAMVDLLPWVVKMTFDGISVCSIEKINLY